MSYIATISSKGWVVIPRELRERYGIRPGGKVLFTESESGLTIVPLPEDPIKSFKGIFKEYPLVDELLEARKEEVAREELRTRQLRDAGVLPE
ncbi:AbrB family looped-hinge helix DNA binding protein [Desulfofundulus luciae]|uniref:AbrB family looped-hinge helix DNA binding protein n=1 Tax=Desulfofundulus luciae TaxID=74702 RepID=A0ABU0B0M0_9FIRM|nr:AbrB/MazE/SpoVT family DNA-binding domain-containing protein [Desulfofundulus luciae]MDQ0286247.1 AbrB family looped-hinge helix DNA binding protein [Desulfofundulus luciae]